MKLDDLNRWLTLAANLGVILGIVFIGIEMNQSTRATKAQTAQEIWNQLASYTEWLSTFSS